MKKRVLAIMLVCFMLVSLLPMGALAEEIKTSNCPGAGNKHYLEQMNEGEYEFVEEVASTTCGGFNYKLWKCLKCGDFFASDVTSNGLTCDWVLVEEKAASCEEEGFKKYECKVCKDTKTETIAATGHTKGDGVATGDCTTGVTVTYTCTVCGKEIETVTGQSGHNLPKVPVISEDEKWAFYGCQNEGCDYVKNVPIYCHIYTEEFQYNIVTIPGKTATCTEAGYTESIVCSACNEVIKAATPIAKVPCDKNGKVFKMADAPIMVGGEYGFRYVFSFEEDTEVTFYTKNESTWVTVQQYAYDEDWEEYSWVNKFAENIETNSITYQDVDEDGNEDGLTFKLEAGVQYRLTNWDAAAAVYQGAYVEGCIENPGDCNTMPYRTWNCSMCGQDWNEYYCKECGKGNCDCEDLRKQNHNLQLMDYIPATCTTHGFIVYGCIDCGKINENQVIPSTNHKETKLVGKTAPTCTKAGYTGDTVCKACGEVMAEGEVIPAKGHTWADYTIPGTCAVPSYSYKYCTVKGCDGDKAPVIYDGNANVSIPNSKNHVVMQYSLVVGATDPNVHNWQLHKYLNEDTCTEVGIRVDFCDGCSAYKTEVINNIKDHTWKTLGENPTCGTAGWTQQQCKTCGELTERVELPAQPATATGVKQDGTAYTEAEANKVHDFEGVEKVVIRVGNCEILGLYKKTCNDCGIAILILEPETGTHKKPTNLGKYDPNWKPLYTEAQVATAKMLNGTVGFFNWGYPEVTFTPDAEIPTIGTVTYRYRNVGEGVYAYVVNADGEIEFTYVSGTEVEGGLPVSYDGNYFVLWGNKFAAYSIQPLEIVMPVQEHAYTDSTCAEYGWTEQWYCERCDELVKTAERIEKKEHVLVGATCTTPGYCKNCETMNTDANGHKWGEEIVLEATCTTAGYTTRTCETCKKTEKYDNVAKLGHNLMPVYMQKHIEIVDIENGWYQIGFVQWECTRCGDGFGDETNGYGFIVDYKGIDCAHEFFRDDMTAFNDIPSADCKTPNKIAYECACGMILYVDGTEYVAHKNENGEVLLTNDCTNKVEGTRVCAACGQTFELADHVYVVTSYGATCQNVAYDMYQCACGDNYVIKTGTEKGDHAWSDWAAVKEDGIIVGQVRACEICYEEQRENVTNIAYSATIENALVPGAAITDGSTVKVTISISGSEDMVWGFQLDVPYSANMTFVKAEFVTSKFTYAQVANDNGGYITVIANAAGEEEVTGTEAVVELYFTVATADQFVTETLTVDFANVQTLDAAGKPVDFLTVSASVETIVLMDLDEDGEITLADALALYNLIEANGYNAAADLDKDKELTLNDFLALYDYLSGVKEYEDIVALQ